MMTIEGWMIFSTLLHAGAFLIFFAAAVHSYRQGEKFRRAKAELDGLYEEGKRHIERISHEGNNEVLKWIYRNAAGTDDGPQVPK